MAGKAKAAPKQVKQKRKRAKKDPNAPKRALSSFMFFAKDKREEICSKNPALRSDIAKVGKMIGEAWAKLGPNDKAPYDKKANADKARYDKEMIAYKKKSQ